MRTTLDIDDDVLDAAKRLAKQRKSTAGEVISNLVRHALTAAPAGGDEEPQYRNGFRLLPRTGTIITSDMVRKWLEEDA